MKNRDAILKYIKEKNPIISVHEHFFTYNHVPDNFLNIRITKNRVWGVPCKEWMLAPMEGLVHLLSHIPFFVTKEQRATLERTRKFLDTIRKETSTIIAEQSMAYETESIHTGLMMDMRNGIGGNMNKSIDEQGQEMLDLRNKYPHRMLIFWAVDPNQPDMYNKAIEAIEVKKFDGIKVYPSLGYMPSHPELMRLFAYCEKNEIPVTTHCSSATVRRTDEKYHLKGKIRRNGMWVDIDQIKKITKEPDVATATNAAANWIPVMHEHPNLFIDFGHFHGNHWSAYLKGAKNGVVDVIDICQNYKNAYTDCSYTFSEKPEYAVGLKNLLEYSINSKQISPYKICDKVLWGSDLYMDYLSSEYESARSYFFKTLGADLMNRLTKVNPKNFLKLNE